MGRTGVPMTEKVVGPDGSALSEGLGALRIQYADQGPGLRWFIQRGATTWFNRGFKTKAQADAWIADHGHALDWRVGYLFRLRGDRQDVQIVDRHGRPPRT